MSLSQPMARFVQRHCFNVNIPPVGTPDEAVVVEDLAESDVGLAVVVNIGRGAGCGVNENERECDADDVGGKPAGMSDVGEEEWPSSFAEKGLDYSYIEIGNGGHVSNGCTFGAPDTVGEFHDQRYQRLGG